MGRDEFFFTPTRWFAPAALLSIGGGGNSIFVSFLFFFICTVKSPAIVGLDSSAIQSEERVRTLVFRSHTHSLARRARLLTLQLFWCSQESSLGLLTTICFWRNSSWCWEAKRSFECKLEVGDEIVLMTHIKERRSATTRVAIYPFASGMSFHWELGHCKELTLPHSWFVCFHWIHTVG